jgi:hypothetical protein
LGRRGQFKGVVVRPILSSSFNSRGHVDLVDMQSMPDGIYRSIMNYEDHLTKFCVVVFFHEQLLVQATTPLTM